MAEIMSTWTEVFLTARAWLTSIWEGIFSIEIFDGLTFKTLWLGLIAFAVGMMIFKYLLSNTHAGIGISDTDTVHTVTDEFGKSRTNYIHSSTRRRKHF